MPCATRSIVLGRAQPGEASRGKFLSNPAGEASNGVGWDRRALDVSVCPEFQPTEVCYGEAEGPSSHYLRPGLTLRVILASPSYQAGLDKPGQTLEYAFHFQIREQ